MTIATADEIQNDFIKYLGIVKSGGEVIVLNDGIEIARLVSSVKSTTPITDSLVGILKGNYDPEEIRKERLHKYDIAD